MIKKIVIIGPESTGKSTLCEQLAAHYNSVWCPEYAREYLLQNGTNYTFDDLATIAKGQVALEDEYVERVRSQKLSNIRHPASKFQPLFIDTDMYVMKVWCEFVFGQCHRFILDEIVARKYDLYLLCNTDLPWTRDELREYPDLETRETLFKMYKDLLVNQSTPWVEIKGSNDDRLKAAIDATEKLLYENQH
ncbi:AAA family ATPase [Niabella yanshanensis]|uniref:AAA family ATPase n=1 Tax=Niabella yanshanensis TaxID=577386 RepID=A0ABZ0W3K3_9BACT|nr:AAA family ATPase [Niabella yanshanensis]WQD36595.1 AAA family ATPase [Niabella yanshanensis]